MSIFCSSTVTKCVDDFDDFRRGMYGERRFWNSKSHEHSMWIFWISRYRNEHIIEKNNGYAKGNISEIVREVTVSPCQNQKTELHREFGKYDKSLEFKRFLLILLLICNVLSMMKLLEALRAKPSDRNIRIIRTTFAVLLLIIIFFGFPYTTWNWHQIPQVLLYILYVFPVIWLIRGIIDPGCFRRKIWKWVIFSLGTIMMILSIGFIETDTHPRISSSSTSLPVLSGESISATSLINTNTQNTQPFLIDTDFWFGFFGFWVAMIGLVFTSKNITTKNERYGEKVTKIRV